MEIGKFYSVRTWNRVFKVIDKVDGVFIGVSVIRGIFNRGVVIGQLTNYVPDALEEISQDEFNNEFWKMSDETAKKARTYYKYTEEFGG